MATATPSRRIDRADLQRRVRHPLQALRGYIRRYITLEGLGVALLYLALWFWIGLALDFGSYWLFGFDWIKELGKLAQGSGTDIVLRGIFLGVLISGLVTVVVWKVLLRLTREFSDPALALVLERRYPRELGDRLITAVEMADPRMAEKYGYSQELVDKTVNDAANRVEELPVSQVFNWGRLGKLAALVFGLPIALYLVFFVVYLIWGAIADRPATPMSYVHRFNGVTATWMERNVLLRNTEWPPTSYLEVVRFRGTPKQPDEMRLGLDAQRPDIQVRAVEWIIFDGERSKWRPLMWNDLPELLGDDLPRIDIPETWDGWVIDRDDVDPRVPDSVVPLDWHGKTSGEIRRTLAEPDMNRFLARVGAIQPLEDLLNWKRWPVDRLALQEAKGEVRRALKDEHPAAHEALEETFARLLELIDSGRYSRTLRRLEVPDRVYATFYHRDIKNDVPTERDKSKRTQTHQDWKEDNNNKFALSLVDLKDSVEFIARAGNYTTEPKQIKFFPAPAVQTLTAHKEEPAYLYYRLKGGDQTPLKGLRQYVNWPAPVEGDESAFSVPFGTTITLEGHADRELRMIRVAPPPADRKGIVPEREVELQKDPKTFQLHLGQLVKGHDFMLEYHDADGIEGKRRIKIEITDDAAPKVEALDLQVVLRNPKDKSGNKLPIRLKDGRSTSNAFVVTKHALIPWKGKITDDIALTEVKWEYTVDQTQVDFFTSAKGKDQERPVTPAEMVPLARVVSGLQFAPVTSTVLYAPRHWHLVGQLVEADMKLLAGGMRKSWADTVPLEVFQEKLADLVEKELTIDEVRKLLRTSPKALKFVKEYDLRSEDGFDFPKLLPMLKVDTEREGARHFFVRATVTAVDNNIELPTGPAVGRFAKAPYEFIVVSENEFLNEIFKEEELLREKLSRVVKRLKDAKVTMSEQAATLTSPDADLSLVQIRLDETRRTLSDTGSDTRIVRDDYQRIVTELKYNVDREAVRAKKKSAVDDKLGVTRDKIFTPLERLFGQRDAYPTCEEAVQNLYEAVERDLAAKTGNVNRDANAKAARLCQEHLDWLIEDLGKILDEMEGQVIWHEVVDKAIQLERTQRQYADQARLWYNEEVRRLLEDALRDPTKKDEKK